MIKHAEQRSNLPANCIDSIKGNFFYTQAYWNYLAEDNYPIYVFNEKFVILAVLYNKWFFRFAQFPVEYINFNSRDPQLPQVFLDDVIGYLKKKFRIQWVNPSSVSAFFDFHPTNSLRIPFGSHVIDLSYSEDELWSRVHSKHRNSVKRAEKANIVVRFGAIELLNDYMKLDAETRKRSNSPSIDKSHLLKMFNFFPKNILISISYKDDIPQGGGIFFYNKSMSYYMYGASKNQPESGAMNLLQWRTILHMKQIGIAAYSFVGCRINEDEDSKYHDIQRFKQGFGGELKVGFMFKVINSPIYYKLFRLLIKVKRGPGSKDVIDQEIHKWKNLNNV